MSKLSISPERVFHYFEEISAIPRGSGNMDGISTYCMDFAAAHSLRAVRDDADNVVIFKSASAGYENAEPIILQGHIDMVCQKTDSCGIDFEKDGLSLYIDGDFLKAEGTTLGADNGIAVAMIMAILESDTLSHPPIEAVFTTDEEIGMLGAMRLDTSILKGRRMINLDAEEDWAVTVSCAGGSDFVMTIPTSRERVSGELVEIAIKGLMGGHSGMEINSGRVNASILAGRVLNHIKKENSFRLVSINGGDKGNAITNSCTIQLVTAGGDKLVSACEKYFKEIEIAQREPYFAPEARNVGAGEYDVADKNAQEKLEFVLICAPNGVMEMSAEIEGLVETSLNLGILKTEADKITLHFTLRSNKQSEMNALEERLAAIADYVGCEKDTFGHYPPWEFRENSQLQGLYKQVFSEKYGHEPEVCAIHAGLECGTFSSRIDGLDCIAIGPTLYDVHTTAEKLSISSTKATYELLVTLLEKCK